MPNVRPLSTDPLRSFKFNVAIQTSNSTQGLGSEARLGFMSVSGIGLSIEPLTYREGGDNLTTRKMPGQADFNPLTLSRGLFYTDFDNWVWMTNLFTAMYGGANPQTGAVPANDFRTVMYINLLDHPNNMAQNAQSPYGITYPYQNNIVRASWKFFSAWPGSIAYSDFDAGGNAVAVEQMTINHEGFDMLWGGQFPGGFVPPGTVNNW